MPLLAQLLLSAVLLDLPVCAPQDMGDAMREFQKKIADQQRVRLCFARNACDEQHHWIDRVFILLVQANGHPYADTNKNGQLEVEVRFVHQIRPTITLITLKLRAGNERTMVSVV